MKNTLCKMMSKRMGTNIYLSLLGHKGNNTLIITNNTFINDVFYFQASHWTISKPILFMKNHITFQWTYVHSIMNTAFPCF